MLLREQLSERSVSSIDEPRSYDGRRVCYLSMEFLPGRIILYASKTKIFQLSLRASSPG